jgi:chemotaxis protein methyltransferase CheR
MDPEILKYFSALIEKEIGIRYDLANGHLLANRLQDLSRSLGYTDFILFWAEVKTRGLKVSEREMILDLATNNETSFFRDPEIFEFMRNEFIPKMTSPNKSVRIWCAATSTGQEPYSLAMCFAQMRDAGTFRDYSLLATDYSQRVLDQAASGTYSQLEVQRGLPAALLVRHFEEVAGEAGRQGRFKIKGELAKSITFKRLNLLDSWTHGAPFDIVFCRNVLIYQDVENKRRVIARIAQNLTPEGILVLGGAESLLGLSDEFSMKQFGKACVYQLKPRLMAAG